MKLVSLKTATECPLEGITCDFIKEDGAIRSIELRDVSGHLLVVRTPSAYEALKIMTPQEFERCDRWKLTGNFLGVAQIAEYFESDYDAQQKLREYDQKAHGDSGLTIERLCVFVDDAGEVVKEIA